VFVAAISRFAASQVMKSSAPRNWSKIRVLPLGVDPADLTPHHPSPEEAAPIRIVSVATLAPVKGFHILLAAAAILARRGRRLELTIVGDGPDRPALEEAIAKLGLTGAVHLAGRCNHDRVIDHYRAADIFALASFAEGVPVVLMEAMAMEIPCVATWITGIPELIRDGVDGLLGPPGDPETLADAIASLMDDPELRLRLGQSARRRIVESYDLKRNSNRLAEEFRRVAGSPGEPSAEQ
jgi:glycosyltransferase involved in cell wall biosynthesis